MSKTKRPVGRPRKLAVPVDRKKTTTKGKAYFKRNDDEIASALRTSRGLLTYAAAKLGCNRTTIMRHVQKSAELQAIVAEQREVGIDITIGQLYKAIEAGEIAAIIWMLKTWGKSRGFVERQEIEHSGTLDNKMTIEIVKV